MLKLTTKVKLDRFHTASWTQYYSGWKSMAEIEKFTLDQKWEGKEMMPGGVFNSQVPNYNHHQSFSSYTYDQFVWRNLILRVWQ